MTLVPADRDRYIVPRWRRSSNAASYQELAATRQVDELVEGVDANFLAREAEFERAPGLWTAADLISAAAARGIETELVRAAASVVRSHHAPTAALSLLIAGPDVPTPDLTGSPARLGQLGDEARERVRIARAELSERPRNAFRWLDLALAHVTLGNVGSGRRAIETSLALAPQNRLVLRSAARFFVHVDDPEQALFWLERSQRLTGDPWLLAAHISVSQVAEIPMRNVRDARLLLGDASIASISASELSAAVATQELGAGKDKSARALMTKALLDPTENSVAQAIWARDKGLSGVDVRANAVPRAFEADTLAAMQTSDWDSAQVAVEGWLADEPFSLRASVHGSYIAITGHEDYQRAYELADFGLRSNPGDPMLLNNAAFALANLGRIEEANDLLTIAEPEEPTLQTLIQATRGLVAFRDGEVLAGRERYRDAIGSFIKRGETDLAALCQVMWTREEVRASTDLGKSLASQLSLSDPRFRHRDTSLWISRVKTALGAGPTRSSDA